jgi:hypothetical protein
LPLSTLLSAVDGGFELVGALLAAPQLAKEYESPSLAVAVVFEFVSAACSFFLGGRL